MKNDNKSSFNYFSTDDGILYVKFKYAGIPSSRLLTSDGIRITFFGEMPYLKVDDAIQWHKREIEATEGQWKREFMNMLIEAKRRH